MGEASLGIQKLADMSTHGCAGPALSHWGSSLLGVPLHGKSRDCSKVEDIMAFNSVSLTSTKEKGFS